MRSKKSSLLKKIVHPIYIKEEFVTDFAVLAAEYAYTPQELKRLPRWYLRALQSRGQKWMCRHRTDASVMTVECAEAFSLPVGESIDTVRRSVKDEEWTACFRLLFQKNNPPAEAVWITDRTGQKLCKEWLAILCHSAQHVYLVTDEPQRLEPLCQWLFEEYGTEPEMLKNAPTAKPNHWYVDLDKGKIRQGSKGVLDGMYAVLHLYAYHVDATHLAEEYPMFSDYLTYQPFVLK